MSKNQKQFPIRRLAIDAVLIAMFYALSLFALTIGGIKLTFTCLPIIIAAMAFGPVDGFLVGFLGAFLEQMLKFGFTPTTMLWILPLCMHGLVIGMAAVVFRKQMTVSYIIQARRPIVYFASCLTAGVVTSLLNTLAYYVDAKMFHYYTYELIFGVLGLRILSGLIVNFLGALVALPVLVALYKANLVAQRNPNVQ